MAIGWIDMAVRALWSVRAACWRLSVLLLLGRGISEEPVRAQVITVFAEGIPAGSVTQLADGRVLVTEHINLGLSLVVAYAADGTRLGTFADGFDIPRDVIQLSDGRILVSHTDANSNGNLKAFAPDGTPLGIFGGGVTPYRPGRITQLSDGRVLVADVSREFGRWVWAFGSDGTPLGLFADIRFPRDVAQHVDGRVLITETGPSQGDSSRVVAFSPDGTRLGTFAAWFDEVVRIEVLQDGRVLVLERTDRFDRIREFAPDGTPLGLYAEGFYSADGIEQLVDGRVFVSEAGSVMGFAPDGAPLGARIGGIIAPSFLTQLADGSVLVANFHRVSALTVDGTLMGTFGAGQFLDGVAAVAQLADGRVLVGESFGDRVRTFSADGAALGVFAEGVSAPAGITQLADGRVLVVESQANRVLVFGPDASPQGVFAAGLASPFGVAQLTDGRVLVTGQEIPGDATTGRVWAFTPDGTPQGFFAEGVLGPRGVEQLMDGRVVIASGSRLRVFGADGTFQGEIVVDVLPIGVTQLSGGQVLFAGRAFPQQATSRQVWSLFDVVVSTERPPSEAALTLEPAIPNPSGAAGATVRYSLAQPGPARLSVHDVLGREVAVLAAGHHAAGDHSALLAGRTLNSGVYVVRLEGGGHVLSKRLTVRR